MSTALRVGLIGYGYAGRTLHAPLIHATPGLTLAAVASSDPAKVHADQGTEMPVLTPDDLIAQDVLDVIVIAVPNALHHPLALAALRAGRHVVVDKPFTLDLRQARELSTAAVLAERMLSVFHNRRWDSDFLTLQALLREGRLGRVVAAQMHVDRYRPAVRARWREGGGPGAGLWMDLGPHLLDQTVQLFGPPQFIALERVHQRDGAVSDDGFHARLRWRQDGVTGLRVDLHASLLAARPGPRFVVHGSLGSVVIEGADPQEEALKALVAAGTSPSSFAEVLAAPTWGRETRRAALWLPADGVPPVSQPWPLQAGNYAQFYAGFRDAVRGHGPNPVTLSDALAVQTLLDLGVECDESGRECAVAV